MNNDDYLTDPASGLPLPTNAPAQLPLDFEGFYLGHQGLYHAYAHAQLGDERAATDLVHRAFLQILAHWEALLREDDLEQKAWAVLRQLTAAQLRAERRRPSFIADGSFARALRASQEQMHVLEGSIGLYSALAELPPRQFDVILLRYALGYPTHRIAWFLGLDERTVDYHGRRAKERLAIKLGITPRTPNDEEGTAQ